MKEAMFGNGCKVWEFRRYNIVVQEFSDRYIVVQVIRPVLVVVTVGIVRKVPLRRCGGKSWCDTPGFGCLMNNVWDPMVVVTVVCAGGQETGRLISFCCWLML